MMNDVNRRERGTVFLDRDGTINVDVPYLADPDRLTLFPDVIEALARLNRGGVRVVLVTNQSGVARGLVSPRRLDAVHARLQGLLQAGGAWLDAIYYCPHHPDDGCSCRKPRAGLVARACRDLGLHVPLEPAQTCPGRARRDWFVVGDQESDLKLAETIGGRGVLVTTGPTSASTVDAIRTGEGRADCVAGTFSDAVDWILDEIAQGAWVSSQGGDLPRSGPYPPFTGTGAQRG